jgi:hypothetical protein
MSGVVPTAPPVISTPPTLCPADRKLYLPYSSLRTVMPRTKHELSSVTVHWFVADRQEPIAPYASVILGYKTLSDTARARAEMLVNELFREDEFHQLRVYLRARHHEDPRISMLTTPVASVKPDTGTRAGSLRPFGRTPWDEREEIVIYRLSDEPGYLLPFAVWGAYIAPNHTLPNLAKQVDRPATNRTHGPEAEEMRTEVEGKEDSIASDRAGGEEL